MVLVALRVFNLNRFTTGASVAPFRVLTQNEMTGDNVYCKN